MAKLASPRSGRTNFGQSLAIEDGVLLVTESADVPNGQIAPVHQRVRISA